MIGHTSNEGLIFADPTKDLNSEVEALLASNFPNASDETLDELLSLYRGGWPLNFARLSTLIGEWVVSCNVSISLAAQQNNFLANGRHEV